MSLANYTDLLTAVGNWMNRADLTARIPEFIPLVEAKLNRLLEDPNMDVSSTTTATSDYTALPTDFGEMISISTGDGMLSPVSANQHAAFDDSVTGIPRFYSIVNRTIAFAPRNSTAVINMVYRRRIPALTASSPTNWLMTLAPDCYLYGTLAQAAAYIQDEERAAMWKAAFDETIPELRMDATRRKWGAGSLRPVLGRK